MSVPRSPNAPAHSRRSKRSDAPPVARAVAAPVSDGTLELMRKQAIVVLCGGPPRYQLEAWRFCARPYQLRVRAQFHLIAGSTSNPRTKLARRYRAAADVRLSSRE